MGLSHNPTPYKTHTKKNSYKATATSLKYFGIMLTQNQNFFCKRLKSNLLNSHFLLLTFFLSKIIEDTLTKSRLTSNTPYTSTKQMNS